MGATRRVALTAAAAAVGGLVEFAVALAFLSAPPTSRFPFLARSFPPPHHTPEHAGGVSFRFAMAHDVIHERFPKHGLDHYRERDRLTRERIAGLAPDDPATFPLADDLAVGLDRLGRSHEAAEVLRDKLARQEARGLSGRDLYTTYANLGTVLIHGHFAKAAAGDDGARGRFREGIDFIRKSVEVNPEAHFGRERWQAAIAEFLLAAMEDPTLLKTFDCLGNRLDLPYSEILRHGYGDGYGRGYDSMYVAHLITGLTVQDARERIKKVGAEEGWEAVAVPSHRSPAPFDEPALGIIGMWRQGGGANPHFALALGEIMLRVGQRSIAWSAFERASRLAERYSADPEIQGFLREHCRNRQRDIELTPDRKGGRSAAELRAAFDAELAYGQGYQKDYQEFEAAKIAEGASILDADVFADWPRRGEPVASRSGDEERVKVVTRADQYRYASRVARAWGVFGAGVSAFVMAAFLELVRRFRAARAAAGRRAEERKSLIAAPPYDGIA